MLEQLMDMYDVIVSDSPPYLPVADSSILVKIFKQTVFVHNTIKTGINILQRSKLGLENSGCRIDGIVLNQLKSTLFMDTDAQVNYYYRKKNKDED
jgi:Mrp family chromosome partitioning ATPase